jgi:hypothetical protein
MMCCGLFIKAHNEQALGSGLENNLHVSSDCLHQVIRQHRNPTPYSQPRVRCHAEGARPPLPAQPPPPTLNRANALHTNANSPRDEEINSNGTAFCICEPTHTEVAIPQTKIKHTDVCHRMYIICVIYIGKSISPQHALEHHQLRPRIHHHPCITLSHGHDVQIFYPFPVKKNSDWVNQTKKGSSIFLAFAGPDTRKKDNETVKKNSKRRKLKPRAIVFLA